MRFATYKTDGGKEAVGVVAADGKSVLDLAELGHPAGDMLEFIGFYTSAVRDDLQGKLSRAGIPLEKVVLDAPIPRPRHDIVCVGQNYLEHALESARYKGVEYVKPDYPVYFSKRVDRAVADRGFIPAHADITDKLDYEAELAVVIGKRCDHVEPGNVFEHVFGYTIVNDVSARDLQSNHSQWMLGKSLDGFAPMGPWIVTADEFAPPPRLTVTTKINGELRQNANTSEFIFDIPYLISQLSQGIVLEPGDIVITGTPSGVGMGFVPPKFLKPGDEIECAIEGIGVLRNVVR